MTRSYWLTNSWISWTRGWTEKVKYPRIRGEFLALQDRELWSFGIWLAGLVPHSRGRSLFSGIPKCDPWCQLIFFIPFWPCSTPYWVMSSFAGLCHLLLHLSFLFQVISISEFYFIPLLWHPVFSYLGKGKAIIAFLLYLHAPLSLNKILNYFFR